MQKIPIGIIDKDENIIQKIVAQLKNVQNIESIKFSTNIRDIEIILIKKKPVLVLIGPTYKLDDFEEFFVQNLPVPKGVDYRELHILLGRIYPPAGRRGQCLMRAFRRS